MAVNKVSNANRQKIISKTASALPNRPSERGYTAEQLKLYFHQFVTDNTISSLAELDRVVDEINVELGNAKTYADGIETTIMGVLDTQNFVKQIVKSSVDPSTYTAYLDYVDYAGVTHTIEIDIPPTLASRSEVETVAGDLSSLDTRESGHYDSLTDDISAIENDIDDLDTELDNAVFVSGSDLKTRENTTINPKTVASNVATPNISGSSDVEDALQKIIQVNNSQAEAITSLQNQLSKNKGYFTSVSQLPEPTGTETGEGWYAFVKVENGDDRLYIYDVDDDKWVNTDTDINGIQVINGKTGTSVTLTGDDINSTIDTNNTKTVTEHLQDLSDDLSSVENTVENLNGSNINASVIVDDVTVEDSITDHLQAIFNELATKGDADDVSTNANDIVDIKSRLDTAEGDIDDLERDLDTLEDSLASTAFSNDYDILTNKPIINDDLTNLASPITNQLYRHIGTTTSDFTQYQVYFNDGSEWHKLGEGGGTIAEIAKFFEDNPSFVYSGNPMYLKDLAGESLQSASVQAYITALLSTFDFEDAAPAQVPYDFNRWAVLQSANTTTYTIEFYIQDDGQIYSLAPNGSYVLTQTFIGFLVDKYTKSQTDTMLAQKQNNLPTPSTAGKVFTSVTSGNEVVTCWEDPTIPTLPSIHIFDNDYGIYKFTGSLLYPFATGNNNHAFSFAGQGNGGIIRIFPANKNISSSTNSTGNKGYEITVATSYVNSSSSTHSYINKYYGYIDNTNGFTRVSQWKYPAVDYLPTSMKPLFIGSYEKADASDSYYYLYGYNYSNTLFEKQQAFYSEKCYIRNNELYSNQHKVNTDTLTLTDTDIDE